MDSSMPRIKELHLKNKDKLGNRKNTQTSYPLPHKIHNTKRRHNLERQDT
jgi:hypothetical protein